MVYISPKRFYYCECDWCHRVKYVEKTENIYNAAQAVRSLGWHYGRNGKVKCFHCEFEYPRRKGFHL